ncbi:MAG: 50S ribosomal protein L35 [Planctomycetota bacterium]|nr:MAG: 50S ribosomal protein L35 [Planctomycetota bacterium]
MAKVKRKTHKGMAKRFKLTGSGKKLKRKASGTGHLMSTKNGKRVRHLRKPRIDTLDHAVAKKIARAIS